MFSDPEWRATALESLAKYAFDAQNGRKEPVSAFKKQAHTISCTSSCPELVHITMMLMEGLQENVGNMSSDSLSVAILRYVDTITGQLRISGDSPSTKAIRHLAAESNLPEEVVDIRHQIVHLRIPSLATLRIAATICFQHVLHTFWKPILDRAAYRDRAGSPSEIEHLVMQGIEMASSCWERKGVNRGFRRLKPHDKLPLEIDGVLRKIHSALANPSNKPLAIYFPQVMVDFLMIAFPIRLDSSHSEDITTELSMFTLILLMLAKAGEAAQVRVLDILIQRLLALLDENHQLPSTKGILDELFMTHTRWCAGHNGICKISCRCPCNASKYDVPTLAAHNLIGWLTLLSQRCVWEEKEKEGEESLADLRALCKELKSNGVLKTLSQDIYGIIVHDIRKIAVQCLRKQVCAISQLYIERLIAINKDERANTYLNDSEGSQNASLKEVVINQNLQILVESLIE